MDNIIKSILDNDLYKFTMMQAVISLYPSEKVRFKFFNRNLSMKFPKGFKEAIEEQVLALSKLKITDNELKYLQENCPFLTPFFLDFLKGYQFNPNELKISQIGGDLQIEIEGYWYRTILWEVPLMAMISELYFKMVESPALKEGREALSMDKFVLLSEEKGKALFNSGARYADFGTRRRFSYEAQDRFIKSQKQFSKSCYGPIFVGTSNVHLAHINDTKAIGTHAHEWFMFHAAKYGYRKANAIALGRWADVYNGKLGIALTDTFTTTDFFKSFDAFYARLFDGVRHDSGDPFNFGERVIKHYCDLGIDPSTKTIVFSDGLNVDIATSLQYSFVNRIKVSFGIGTHFTNDFGYIPLNMVIKLTEVCINGEWVGAVKLSDNEGKHTGTEKDIEIAKATLGV